MLKVKQPPAVGLTPSAAADIETGVSVNTDAATQLDPPQDHAPTIVVMCVAHDYNGSDTSADSQGNLEAAQHSRSPRTALQTEATNPAPF